MIGKTAVIAAFMLAAATGPALAADAPKTGTAEKGRDWTKIDTNKDGYIQPEEMEKWLAENPGPEKK